MMDLSRFHFIFFTACLYGIVIGIMGCATNNWSQPLFKDRPSNIPSQAGADYSEQEDAISRPKSFWKQGFGEMSGSDARSREIERSLGF